MSDVLTGNPANITTPLSATILSAVSGASYTTCTTTAAHLFGTSDNVVIYGATGMTGLNGEWTITVTGSTTFTVPSALSGSYGASSATAIDYSLTPQILVPTDGDPFSAQLSGLLSAFEGLMDRTQYINQFISPASTLTLLTVLNSSPVGGQWGAVAGAYDKAVSSGYPYPIATPLPLTLYDGDVVTVTGGVGMEWNGSTIAQGNIELEYIMNGVTGSTTSFSPTTEMIWNQGGTRGLFYPSIPMTGYVMVTETTSNFSIWLNGHVANTGSATDWQSIAGLFIVSVYRPTLG